VEAGARGRVRAWAIVRAWVRVGVRASVGVRARVEVGFDLGQRNA
jgi:hypothetical protein